jgi:hypothetical protein
LYTRFIPFGHAAGAFSLPFSLLSCTSCHPALFLPFSQLYPTAPGGICEMKRWNPYPSKKGMGSAKQAKPLAVRFACCGKILFYTGLKPLPMISLEFSIMIKA